MVSGRCFSACNFDIPLPLAVDVSHILSVLPKVLEENFDALAKQRLSHLPDWTYDEASSEKLMEVVNSQTPQSHPEHADATTGFEAMKVSAALVAASIVAHRLQKTELIDDLMKRIAGRVLANCQGWYLPFSREAWP